MTVRAITNNQGRVVRLLALLLKSECFVLFLGILYFVVLAPFTPGFASSQNLANILATMLPLIIASIGQTLVLITGGIDLSATSIMALTSVSGAVVMNANDGWVAGSVWAAPVGVLTMLMLGAVLGLLNGTAVVSFRMPAFMVTLTSMMFFSGFAIWLTQSKSIYNLPLAFNALGGKTWLAFLITGGVAGVAHLLLSRSLWGRWLYATGHNQKTSFISGVPVGRVVILSYMASGVCAALAAVLYTGQAETASPVLGQRMLLDIIAATVIGGASLFGGKGKILWTIFGVFFIKLIDNSLNLMDLSHFTIMMVKGGVILLAALTDSLRNRLMMEAP